MNHPTPPFALRAAVLAVALGAAGGRGQEPAGRPGAPPEEPPPATAGNAPVPTKVLRYAQRAIARHDADGDGRLSRAEWSRLGGAPDAVDGNGDGVITAEEMAQYVANYGRRRRIRLLSAPNHDTPVMQPLLRPATAAAAPEGGKPPAAESPGGLVFDPPAKPADEPRDRRFYVPPSQRPAALPDWFNARDANGDGQLTVAEFAPKATQADLDDFARYDADGDGVITPSECVRRDKKPQTPSPEPAPAKPRSRGGE